MKCPGCGVQGDHSTACSWWNMKITAEPVNKIERCLMNFMGSNVSFYDLTDGTTVVWDQKTGEVSTLHDEDVRQVA